MPDGTRKELPATSAHRDYIDVFVYVPARLSGKLGVRMGWMNAARVEGTDTNKAVQALADQAPWARTYKLDVCVSRVEETRSVCVLLPDPW